MKNQSILLALALLACQYTSAQQQENRYKEITNPKLLQINKLEPRSSFFSFTNAADAQKAGTDTKGSNFLL